MPDFKPDDTTYEIANKGPAELGPQDATRQRNAEHESQAVALAQSAPELPATFGALTPPGRAGLSVDAADGVYHNGALQILNALLTVVPQQTPLPGSVMIGDHTIEIIANRYDVTSDAEFDEAFAQAATDLEGVTIHVRGANLSRRRLENVKTATGVRIETNSDARIDGLAFIGGGANITIAADLQLTAWPTTHDCIRFGTGHFANITIEGSTLRHGYGPDNVDFEDIAYPEFNRVNHVVTASTIATTYKIDWQDPQMRRGQLFIFNRGGGPAWCAIGGENVAVFAGESENSGHFIDPEAGSGYTRLTGLDPTKDTHFAVVTQAGETEINFRAEIGLTSYLANGISAGGGCVFDGLSVRNNTFSQLSNVAGSRIGGGNGETIIMDNLSRGIYQDIWKFSDAVVNNTVYFLRNVFQTPFAKPGIAEDLGGDAGDPHGDKNQPFGVAGGPGFTKGIISAGNVELPSFRKEAYSQGLYGDTKTTDQPYIGVYSIADVFPFCATRGISFGANVGGAQWGYVYGTTIFGTEFDIPSKVYMTSSPLAERENFVGASVGHSLVEGHFDQAGVRHTGEDPRGMLQQDRNVFHYGVGDVTDIFPNIAGRLTARTRDDMIAALTPAAQFGKVGAALFGDLIDLETNNPADVIKWENAHPGVGWAETVKIGSGDLCELPLRKIKAGPNGMDVVPSEGTEVRIVSSNEATVLTDWTLNRTTADRGEFVQLRRRAEAEGQTVLAGVKLNGFLINAKITPANTTFFLTTSAGPYFVDPKSIGNADSMSAFTYATDLTLDGRSQSAMDLFGMSNLQCRLETRSNGTARLFLQDGQRTKIFKDGVASQTLLQGFDFDKALKIVVSCDLIKGFVRIWGNDELILNEKVTSASGVFLDRSVISFLANIQGANQVVGKIAGLRWWKTATLDGVLPDTAPYAAVDGYGTVWDADGLDVTETWRRRLT